MAYYRRNAVNPYGRSYNAQRAEGAHRLPKSRVGKQAIFDCLDYNGYELDGLSDELSEGLSALVPMDGKDAWGWLKAHGVSVKSVRENGNLGEWHHIGRFARRTPYIDIAVGIGESLCEWEERQVAAIG
jgi:hypothetical protein